MIFSEVNEAIQLCKEVGNLAKKTRDAEIIAKVIDLQSAVMSLQVSILQAQEDHRKAMSDARQKQVESDAKYAELEAECQKLKKKPLPKLSKQAISVLQLGFDGDPIDARFISTRQQITVGVAHHLIDILVQRELIEKARFRISGRRIIAYQLTPAGRDLVVSKAG